MCIIVISLFSLSLFLPLSLSSLPLSPSLPPSLSLSFPLPPSLLPSLQGIGDSGQGFANAILFVLFTPKVRRYFLRKLFCCRSSKNRSSINNRGKSKVFYGAVQSRDSDYSKTELSDDDRTPDAFSRDNEVNPHGVLLNHNT